MTNIISLAERREKPSEDDIKRVDDYLAISIDKIWVEAKKIAAISGTAGAIKTLDTITSELLREGKK